MRRGGRRGAFIALLASVWACANAARPRPAPEPLSAWPPGPRDALDLGRGLLAIDTRRPIGREVALRRLGRTLDVQGLEVEVDPGALVARVGPPGPPAVLLLAHVDTWPVDPSAWPKDKGPFSGAVHDGALFGRGVLGGKGAAALFASALARLARGPRALPRPVSLVVTASGLDPEAPDLARVLGAHPDLNRAARALTTGGRVVRRPGRPSLAQLACGERGFAAVALTAVGPSAPLILGRAVADVEDALPPPKVGRVALRYLEDLSRTAPWPESWMMRAAPLAKALYPGRLAEAPHTRSLVVTEARIAYEAAPAAVTVERDTRARAWMQVFLLEGESPAALLARLRARLDPRLRVDLLEGEPWVKSQPSGAEAVSDAFALGAWARVLSDPSQSRLLIRNGIPTVGFVPLTMTPAEVARRGGPAERVTLAGWRAAAEALPAGIRALTSTRARR